MTPIENKTPCAWVSDRIDPYLDGDLSEGESVVFDNHVDTCIDCREELTLAQTVLTELRSLPAQTCPNSVSEALYADVKSDAKRGIRPWFRGWFLRPAVAGALIAIVVTAMFLVARMERGTDAATPEEIARATAEVQWTIAYVSDVSRRTGLTFQQEVLEERVVTPMRRAVHSAIDVHGSQHPTTEHNGG